MDELNVSKNVGFKIIIEGRAARDHDRRIRQNPDGLKRLSYDRALALYNLWKTNSIIEYLENYGGEVFISGSGLDGKNRYPKSEEEKNKLFIIQIVPYLKK
jgi:hypothetical protein